MPHEDTGREETRPGRWPPAPDEFTKVTYPTAVGDMGDVLLFRVHLDFRDNLVGFAIIQMTRYRGRDVKVAVVDIHCNELHVHYYDKRERRVGQESLGKTISSQKDVDDCYDAAIDWIDENWEGSKRRWSRGGA